MDYRQKRVVGQKEWANKQKEIDIRLGVKPCNDFEFVQAKVKIK